MGILKWSIIKGVEVRPLSNDLVTEEQFKDFGLWIKETERIDELYKDLKPSEIRELVRQYCERIVCNMTIDEIVNMGEHSTYSHMFNIDLDNLDDKTKKFEVDVVLDYKYDVGTDEPDEV
jgi:hypothetical protein